MDAYTEAEEDRIRALKDANAPYTRGLMQLLRTAANRETDEKQRSVKIILPFELDHPRLIRLEKVMGVSLECKDYGARSADVPYVSALNIILEQQLLEFAGAAGRSVLMVDGDVVALAQRRLDDVRSERSAATPRLAACYAMEDDQVTKLSKVHAGGIGSRAMTIRDQLVAGNGDNYSARLSLEGKRVDVVVVNHLRTPASLKQMIRLATARGAFVAGVLPFQTDMFFQSQGELQFMDGEYCIKADEDVVTWISRDDSTFSISHPWDAVSGIVRNASIVVDGVEWMIEKFLHRNGLLFYTANPIDQQFDVAESMFMEYFHIDMVGVTEITYPKVSLSPAGVPTGFTTGVVRIPTDRYEKALQKGLTSKSKVVRPAEIFLSLRNYNNTVVNTLDTAYAPTRISVAVEEEAALAISLLVNFRRQAMSGSLNVLLDAVKLRFSVGEASMSELAARALYAKVFSAWWGKIALCNADLEVDEIPTDQVLDWCGNDFSVRVNDVDPVVKVEQVVGEQVWRECGNKTYPWFPGHEVSVLQRVLNVARKFLDRKRALSPDDSVGVVKKHKSEVSGTYEDSDDDGPFYDSVVRMEDLETVDVCLSEAVVDGHRSELVEELCKQHDAVPEVPAEVELCYAIVVEEGDRIKVPVPEVDVVTELSEAVDNIYQEEIGRDFSDTSYRLAEVDLDIRTSNPIKVNDSLRGDPKPKWVRKPQVSAPVESRRISSQAALLGAARKRNMGVPNNRGDVDLDVVPKQAVQQFVDVCFRKEWKNILSSHLETGLWVPTEFDIRRYVPQLKTNKVQALLKSYFVSSDVDMSEWNLMIKEKLKATLDHKPQGKIAHSQTIMFLDDPAVNAYNSSMTKRFKEVFDQMLRPNVRINTQASPQDHESWYNAMDARRVTGRTYSYACDIHTYDRSQESSALRTEFEFWKLMGLNQDLFDSWSKTFGLKSASNMMFGVVLMLALTGISGDHKTLFRNGLINGVALVVSAQLKREDIAVLDLKGDDSEIEVYRRISVENAVRHLGLTFNFSAKFFTTDVRYMCKQFRIKVNDRWYHLADPWAKLESVCTEQYVCAKEDVKLVEKWVSLSEDLRGYDDLIVLDELSKAVAQYYQWKFVPNGLIYALAKLAQDKDAFMSFYKAPELVC